MTVAGQGQVPVGQLLGQQPPEPSKWATLMSWRDWRLSAKLAAVSLVPIMIALVLGGITIGNQVERSGNYERMNRLVELNGTVRTLVGALQQERTQTTALLTQGTVGSSPQLDAARQVVDAATGPVTAVAAHAADVVGGIRGPAEAATAAVSRLGEVRGQVGEGRLDAVQALAAYSEMTDSLIGLDTALVAGIGDDAIGGTPSALHDLMVVKEETSTAQSLLGYGIARGALTPTQLNDLRTAELRLADRLVDFRAASDSAQESQFDRTVMGQDFNTRSRLVNGVLAAEGSSVPSALRGVSAEQWTAVSASVIAALDTVGDSLGDQLETTSADLADDAGTDAGLLAVLLFAALVVTAAVVILITRQLLHSLRVLRAGALDIADRQLPAAVRNIQEGREQSTDVQPVQVGTKDEIGEVAKAFDEVHSQALRLAVEQANMRTGYSSVFVNLSRRSQSLVQRQLQLIERLERDEEDADQLATLFQLDHLATRMRRNNENLMVLSGAEPGRRSGQPVSTSDVLRAAVSEIEQYQRVVVQTPPEARIVGFASSDLMRLVAELLDNATAFSAPETQVTVTTRASDHRGLVIDIIDKGIGMNEAEVAEANVRLTEAGTVDLATSRRMGLFVVGRLAGRHNIGVVLHGGKDIVGVRATVTVPADLVMDLPAPAPAPALPQPEPGLPRRRTVNGAGRPGGIAGFGDLPTPGDGANAPSSWAQNGHSGVLPPRPPSDLEISGTALFTPLPSEEGEPPSQPLPEAPVPEAPAPEDPAAEVADTESAESGELPSGKALFTANSSPLSDWWSSAANEPKPATPPPSRRETTPIFDETLSAWFRSDDPPPAKTTGSSSESTSDETAGGKATSGWDFAADESFRAVQARSQVEPKSFTDAGLPKRRRGEQLLPGSANGDAAAPAPKRELPTRDPADVRGRLSSFQHGVNRARHAKRAETAPEGAAAQPGASSAEVPESASRAESAPQAQPEAASRTESGLPRRQPRPGAESAARSAGESAPQGEDLPQREPSVQGAAEGAEQAKEVGESAAQGEGLPRRQARPGAESAAQAAGESAARSEGLPQRQPRPGAESAAQAKEGAARSEGLPQRQPRSGAEGAAPAASSESGLPQRRPAAEAPQLDSGLPQRRPKPSAGAQPEGGLPQPSPRTADASSDSGLPRRRPKAEGAQPESGLPQRQPKGARPEEPGPRQPEAGEQPSTQPQAAQAEPTQPQPEPTSPQAETALPRREPESGLPQRRPRPETAAGLPQRQARPAAETGAGLFQHAAPEPGTGLFARPGADQRPARPQPDQETPQPRREPAEGEGAWSFATDESWAAVQTVSSSSPSSFTSAGLPKRRRGEQLLPGSALSPQNAATPAAPRTRRDPQDVRGRLSSFQQGVQRGRHRTAQSADPEQGTMEGE
ncbi:nitrate- and nitrite sensing domain-containing protein [Amycolatopsis endophytica]